jgi:hypothetical protein
MGCRVVHQLYHFTGGFFLLILDCGKCNNSHYPMAPRAFLQPLVSAKINAKTSTKQGMPMSKHSVKQILIGQKARNGFLDSSK